MVAGPCGTGCAEDVQGAAARPCHPGTASWAGGRGGVRRKEQTGATVRGAWMCGTYMEANVGNNWQARRSAEVALTDQGKPYWDNCNRRCSCSRRASEGGMPAPTCCAALPAGERSPPAAFAWTRSRKAAERSRTCRTAVQHLTDERKQLGQPRLVHEMPETQHIASASCNECSVVYVTNICRDTVCPMQAAERSPQAAVPVVELVPVGRHTVA